jgi:hypothetical protein
MLSTLQADFARIPGLLAAGPGERPPHVPELAAVGAAPAAPAGPEPAEPPVEQLGLF